MQALGATLWAVDWRQSKRRLEEIVSLTLFDMGYKAEIYNCQRENEHSRENVYVPLYNNLNEKLGIYR